MIPLNITIAIEKLDALGLNIFLTAPIGQLPREILESFINQKINFQMTDTLIVVGHGGKKLWSSLKHPLDLAANSIDDFSLSQLNYLNDEIFHDKNFQVLYPHTHLQIPLQKIGRFLKLAAPSPLGIDISHAFGLWFAYRGVALTSTQIPAVMDKPFVSACELCLEKPCLKESLIDLSRQACPYKREHQYTLEQIQYHCAMIKKMPSLII